MRIFVALDIGDAIRERIHRFMEGVSGFAPDVRWVRPASLHITLKFIGETTEETVQPIKSALAGMQCEPIEITFRGYGFFPAAKSARVFWLGIEAGPRLAALAKSIDESMFALGTPREDHAFSPHLTLARGGRSGAPQKRTGDAPNQKFHRLQEKLGAMTTPDFGTMTAREFFLYQSQLSREGSRYTKIARFALM